MPFNRNAALLAKAHERIAQRRAEPPMERRAVALVVDRADDVYIRRNLARGAHAFVRIEPIAVITFPEQP
jgi:hypothetical protein